MSIIIRDIEAADEARWRELWQGYLTFYETEIPSAVTDISWQRLLDANEPGMFSLLACDEDGTVLGFANCVLHPITWTEKPVCYLEDLFIDPAARNQGAGRALIEAVRDRGKAKGWHRIYWRTKSDNADARVLYDRVADDNDWVTYEIAL